MYSYVLCVSTELLIGSGESRDQNSPLRFTVMACRFPLPCSTCFQNPLEQQCTSDLESEWSTGVWSAFLVPVKWQGLPLAEQRQAFLDVSRHWAELLNLWWDLLARGLCTELVFSLPFAEKLSNKPKPSWNWGFPIQKIPAMRIHLHIENLCVVCVFQT